MAPKYAQDTTEELYDPQSIPSGQSIYGAATQTMAPGDGGITQPPDVGMEHMPVAGVDPLAAFNQPPPAAPSGGGFTDLLTQGLQAGYGRAPSAQDVTYWMGLWNDWGQNDPNYFLQRVMGMGAGGADAATSGPYAGVQFESAFGGNENPQLAQLHQMLGEDHTTTPDTGHGPDPFTSMGGGTFVPGIGWYPTANLTPDMQAAAAGGGSPAAPAAPAAPPVGGGAAGPDPFASLGGGHLTPDGLGWLPPGMNAPTALPGGGEAPGGGGSTTTTTTTGGGTTTSTPSPTSRQGIDAILAQLLSPEGGFNQKRTDMRVESAREQMDRAAKSRTASDKAQLAEQGIYGSGADATALNAMEEDLAGIYGGQVRDIYADETQSADSRFIRGLELAGMISQGDADRLISQYNAETSRTVAGTGQYNAETNRTVGMGNLANASEANAIERLLGLGNLDLGNRRASIEETLGMLGLDVNRLGIESQYNLGLGNLGLGRDRLASDINNNNQNLIARLIEAGIPMQTLIDAGFLPAEGR